jgi:hypothetical protein
LELLTRRGEKENFTFSGLESSWLIYEERAHIEQHILEYPVATGKGNEGCYASPTF